ncbi:MAG: hypothetical protein QOE40_3151 [Actinomycetota bacterium]|jgi:hypothetical protein|nr:hypothetical protein [Actinomycetota bacterium]
MGTFGRFGRVQTAFSIRLRPGARGHDRGGVRCGRTVFDNGLPIGETDRVRDRDFNVSLVS